MTWKSVCSLWKRKLHSNLLTTITAKNYVSNIFVVYTWIFFRITTEKSMCDNIKCGFLSCFHLFFLNTLSSTFELKWSKNVLCNKLMRTGLPHQYTSIFSDVIIKCMLQKRDKFINNDRNVEEEKLWRKCDEEDD